MKVLFLHHKSLGLSFKVIFVDLYFSLKWFAIPPEKSLLDIAKFYFILIFRLCKIYWDIFIRVPITTFIFSLKALDWRLRTR